MGKLEKHTCAFTIAKRKDKCHLEISNMTQLFYVIQYVEHMIHKPDFRLKIEYMNPEVRTISV